MQLKKGDIELSTIAKLLLGIALLIILVIMIYKGKTYMIKIIDVFKNGLRFR